MEPPSVKVRSPGAARPHWLKYLLQGRDIIAFWAVVGLPEAAAAGIRARLRSHQAGPAELWPPR